MTPTRTRTEELQEGLHNCKACSNRRHVNSIMQLCSEHEAELKGRTEREAEILEELTEWIEDCIVTTPTGKLIRILPFEWDDFKSKITSPQTKPSDCRRGSSGRHENSLKRMDKPVDTHCKYCGCTEKKACQSGCFWASISPPICSKCATKRKML